MQPQTSYLSEQEFNTQYWFTPEQIVTVKNPTNDNFKFAVEGRYYQVDANQQKQLSGFIANVYLDQMSKILAQRDDKIRDMVDPALRAQYYDDLIVTASNIVQEVEDKPEYLRQGHVPAWKQQTDEQPFAQLQPQPIQDVVPPAQAFSEFSQNTPVETTVQLPSEPENTHVAQSSTSSFELNGSTYTRVGEGDAAVFSRDGQAIDAGTFNQAASMLE